MAHDEASAGLRQHVTDTHLADRARLGDAASFDELVRRHADKVARFATVVSGASELAGPVTARAFTDVFDQIGSGGYSIEDPFVPGLLRSTREVARIRAEADFVRPGVPAPAGTADADPLTQAAVWSLDEAQRSVRWLEGVEDMDTYDMAFALGLTEDQVEELARSSAEALGSRAEDAHLLLQSIEADLLSRTADEARTAWRGWLATVAVTPDVSKDRHPRPLLARLEPVATRVLRGAAVVLLVAGAAGITLSGDGDSTRRRSGDQQAGGETGSREIELSSTSPSGPSDATTETETADTATSSTRSSPTSGSSESGPASDGGSSVADGSTPATPSADASSTPGGSDSTDTETDVPGANPAPDPGAGTGTGNTGGNTPPGGPVGGGSTPNPPGTNPSPGNPPPATNPPATNPPATNPPGTNPPPATNPPVTTPPVTTPPPATNPPVTTPPVTTPPVTAPPVTTPPSTLPPITVPPLPPLPLAPLPALPAVPVQPTTTVVDTVTGVVAVETDPLGL